MTTTTTQIHLHPIVNEPDVVNVPAPPKHTRSRIYLITLHTALAGLLYGLDTGSIGPITEMPQFRESVGKMSALTQGFYVSSILLWAALSSFANGYLSDRYSRRYTILFGAVMGTFGAILSSTVPVLAVLFIARALYGIGIGLTFSTTMGKTF